MGHVGVPQCTHCLITFTDAKFLEHHMMKEHLEDFTIHKQEAFFILLHLCLLTPLQQGSTNAAIVLPPSPPHEIAALSRLPIGPVLRFYKVPVSNGSRRYEGEGQCEMAPPLPHQEPCLQRLGLLGLLLQGSRVGKVGYQVGPLPAVIGHRAGRAVQSRALKECIQSQKNAPGLLGR
ncbi:hypothetical protein U0070_024749, partial [Myodes glareolus]